MKLVSTGSNDIMMHMSVNTETETGSNRDCMKPENTDTEASAQQDW